VLQITRALRTNARAFAQTAHRGTPRGVRAIDGPHPLIALKTRRRRSRSRCGAAAVARRAATQQAPDNA
jgi:hypothetical protein